MATVTMDQATRPIVFEFFNENGNNLTYSHNIPSSLIGVGAKFAQDDAEYIDRAQRLIHAAWEEREPACRAVSNPRCGMCGSPTTKLVQTPVSYLHAKENPSVSIFVHAVCDDGKCEIKTRQQTRGRIAQHAEENPPKSASAGRASVEFMACKVCRKTEGTMRCARCKAIAYCGREHQKADWKMHKQECLSVEGHGFGN